MSYFLSTQNLTTATNPEIFGEEFRHLISRRVKKGEVFYFQDQSGERHECEILAVNKNSIQIKPRKKIKVPNVPEKYVVLFLSVISEKSLDYVFQKTTELGVGKIVIFNSENTALKLTEAKFKNKHGRWNKILWEACKQSDRQFPPTLTYLPNLDLALEEVKDLDLVYLCDCEGGGSLESKNKKIGVMIGPEGGFTDKERFQIKQKKNTSVLKLSENILKADTASIVGVSLLINN